jgi:hypothetical protein
MQPRQPLRIALIVSLALVVALAGAGWWFLERAVQGRVLAVLGPRATIGSVALRFPSLVLEDVRIGASGAPSWPAQEEAHAKRVAIRMSPFDLWSAWRGAPLRVAEIAVEDGYLAILRTPGNIDLLPALRERPKPPPAPAAPVPAASQPAGPALVLDHVHLERMQVDVFDATLGRPKPYRLELDDTRADLDNLRLPTMDEPVAIDIRARLKGVDNDGPVSLKGSFAPTRRDADLALRSAGADLVVLQPYLLRHGEGGVRHGRMDLQLDAHVASNAIRAPGHLTITGLEFTDQGGTFAGVEHRAVMATLARDGRIDVHFTLEGRLDDPKFSLDEGLGKRFAAGLAEVAGVSVKSVVESVGDAIKGLLGGNK